LGKQQNNQSESSTCEHKNVKKDGRDLVCRDCGLILDNNVVFEEPSTVKYFSNSQLDYERRIRLDDTKATQDPAIKQQYDKLKTLDKWFQDYQSSFTEQKKTIELLKSYGIGLNIDAVKYQEIKDRYLKYNKYHRHTYQNMVIIFLAIVWMEIKETTNIRIEEFIKASAELGHKINKKMLNNAMEKVKRTEKMINKVASPSELERDIKERIKILFQKDLNNIPFEMVQQHFNKISEYNKLKIDMQLTLDKILSKITYHQIQNFNYKAFTAGLIYYIGQTLDNHKIFTQSIIEETSKFSSTTIRKKFHTLKDILGEPQDLSL